MSSSKELLDILDSGQIRSWRSHKHAFRPLPFCLASVCGVCGRSTFGNFYSSVRCVSCDFVAHRSCAAPETAMEVCPNAPSLDRDDATTAEEEPDGDSSDDVGALAIAGGVGVGIAGAIFGSAVAGPAGALMGINLGRYAGVGLAAAKVGLGAGGAVVGYRNGRKAAENHRKWSMELQAKKQWDSITGVRAGLIALGKLQDVEIPAVWRETAKRIVHPEESERTKKHSLMEAKRFGSGDSDWLVLDFNECTREEEVQLLILRAFQEKDSLLYNLHSSLLALFQERHPNCGVLNDKFLKQEDVRDAHDFVEAPAFSAALDAYGFTHEVLAVVLLQIPGLRNCVETVVAAINGVDRYIFADIYGAVFEELSRHAKTNDDVLAQRISTLKEVRMRILSGRRDQERRYSEAVLVDEDEIGSEDVDDDFDFEHMLPDSDMQDWYHTGYSLDAKRFLSTRAIKLLKKMQVASTALDKLRTVVAALEAMSAMEIQVQAARHGKSAEALSLQPVGTDELLPSLCAHLVQAGVNDLHAQLSFIRAFCRDDYRTLGTEGYALSSLEAALQIIMIDAHYDEPGSGGDDLSS